MNFGEIKPANLAPHEAAQRLRLSLKQTSPGGGSNVTNAVSYLNVALQTLVNIELRAPERRTALTRSLAQSASTNVRNALDMLGSGSYGGLSEERLAELYSLVLVLPTVPNPPTNKADDSLRAIGAIVKAYFGIFDKEIADIPGVGLVEDLLLVVKAHLEEEEVPVG